MTAEAIVRRSIEDAFRAPSSHNSQPWGVVWIRGDRVRDMRNESLIICLVPDRCLHALPAHRGEMLVSAGAFIENFARSLKGEGAAVSAVRMLPEESWPRYATAVREWEPLGLIDFETCNTDRSSSGSREWLEVRTTNRGAFAQHLPDGAAAIAAEALSVAFPDATEVTQLEVITAKERLQRLGRFIARTAGREFSHAEAWQETWRFIRFAGDAIDGLPVDLLVARRLRGVERALTRCLLHPNAVRWLSRLGLTRSFARELGTRVAAGPMALYLSARSAAPDVHTHLAGGARMQAAWIALGQKGMSLHPVSVVLQHVDLHKALIEECDLPAGRGLFFARAGVAMTHLPPSPRLPDPFARVRIV